MRTKTCDIWTPGIFFKLHILLDERYYFLDINHFTNFRHIKPLASTKAGLGVEKKVDNSPNGGDLQVICRNKIDQNTHKFEGIPSCRQPFPPKHNARIIAEERRCIPTTECSRNNPRSLGKTRVPAEEWILHPWKLTYCWWTKSCTTWDG